MKNALRAFGESAAWYASLLPADLCAIVCDLSGLRDAYAEAVERREAGELFLVHTLLGGGKADIAGEVARTVSAEGLSADRRRLVFDQFSSGQLVINERPVSQLTTIQDADAAIIADLHLLADATLVRSQAELATLVALIGRSPNHVATYAAPDPSIPEVTVVAHDRLVLWAPNQTWDKLAAYTTALQDFRFPVTIIAADAPPHDGAPHTWVRRQDAAANLARAAAIVDASVADPHAALALAKLGVPLAVTTTGGAAEYLDGAVPYVPWDWRSIQRAASTALGALHASVKAPAPESIAATLAHAAPPLAGEGPLVSVVIPTYNRRDDLTRAMRCIERQTYRNIECIVVNDAGEPVDDIVAAYPRARLIDLTENGGGLRALNIGARETTGKYFCILPDDDVFYPDHLSRLVAALERTGAGLAHGNVLIRYLLESEGTFRLHGFNASTFSKHADPVNIFVSSSIPFHAELVRRDLLEAIGWFDEAFIAVADLEVQMRLAARTAFVHVDHTTAEWVVRNGPNYNTGKKYQAQAPEQLARLYERYPLADYASLKEPRLATMRFAGTPPANGWFFQPVVTF